MHALVIGGTLGCDGVDGVVRDTEVAPLSATPYFYSLSLWGGGPAATTEKAVVSPVMALWVAGCVVVEGTVAVTTTAIVIVAGEVEELLTTEMGPEALPVEAGVKLPEMVVLCPSPMELNPTQPEQVEQDDRSPRTGNESSG